MSTIGNTGTPSQTFIWYGLNNVNLLAIQVTMPAGGGQLTNVAGYFAGHGGTINPVLCVWNSAGFLIAQTASMSVGAGSGGLGGQGWQSGALLTPYNAAASEVLYIGLWRPPSQTMEWTEQNGGLEWQTVNASTSPANLTGANTSGTPSFYATYSPLASVGGIKSWTGSSWAKYKVKVWNGSSWIWRPVKTWDGSSWVRRG